MSGRHDSQDREVTQRLALPATPSYGTVRPPAASSALLEQALQRSEVSPTDVPLVTHERVKMVEETVTKLHENDHRHDLRFDLIETKIDASRGDSRSIKAWVQSLAVLAPFATALAPDVKAWAASHPGSALGTIMAVLAAILGAIGRSFVRARSGASDTPGDAPPPATS